MNNNRTVLSRFLFTNWGNGDPPHMVFECSDQATLFTGLNGAGKSTVMDAMVIIMFGSANSNFFNIGKKSSSKEKRRDALSYLRGCRKNLLPVRRNQDFWANIVGEFHDLKTDQYFCCGVIFKVSADTLDGVPTHQFFIVNGRIPSDEFVNYTFDDLDAFVKSRKESYMDASTRICEVYHTDEAYQCRLMEVVFGGIDYRSYVKLQKSAISSEMPDGDNIEAFIRTYLFTKSKDYSCESLINSAKSIKSMRSMLSAKQHVINELNSIYENICEAEDLERVIIAHDDITSRIERDVYKELCNRLETRYNRLLSRKADIESRRITLRDQNEKIALDIVNIESDIKNSNYGLKKSELKQKEQEKSQCIRDASDWEEVLSAISAWTEDDCLPVSPEVINIYENLSSGKIKEDCIDRLKALLNEASESIFEEERVAYREFLDRKNAVAALESELDGLKNDERLYRNRKVISVKNALQNRLSDLYGDRIEVRIFSRTFDITDNDWRNAIEARLAAKSYLIVHPAYYDVAHKEFKKMQTYGVHLIDSKKMINHHVDPKPGSLYECVCAVDDYVDAALKYYLGHIIKCDSIDDFKNHENGIMMDCFCYNQRSSYQLNSEDYEKYASIGLRISHRVIHAKEMELEQEKDRLASALNEWSRLHAALQFETLNSRSTSNLFHVAMSAQRLPSIEEAINTLKHEIDLLSNDDVESLRRTLNKLNSEKNANKIELQKLDRDFESVISDISSESGRLQSYKERLDSFTSIEENSENDDAAVLWIQNNHILSLNENRIFSEIHNSRDGEISKTRTIFDAKKMNLIGQESVFMRENSTCGIYSGWENNEQNKAICVRENEKFRESDLVDYEKLYEDAINKLKSHVIDQLSQDIRRAKNHQKNINIQLRQHKFGNNFYQLDIDRANDEYGAYYGMLMSPNLDYSPYFSDDGQISFSSIGIEKNFGPELNSFIEMFIPPSEDEFSNHREYERQMSEFNQLLEKITDYRTYLKFDLKSIIDVSALDDEAKAEVIDSTSVDSTAGIDSGGEEVSPKYIALLMGFKMLCDTAYDRKSRISLVMMDESFDKLDSPRINKVLRYAEELGLQLVMAVPDTIGNSFAGAVDHMYFFKPDNVSRSRVVHFGKLAANES